MQLFDTVACLRALLLERGVALVPEHAGDGGYRGPGARAQDAWEAFRVVAGEPAADPVHAWGELRSVQHAGFSFDARYRQAREPDERDRGETREHYSLSFTRYFEIGDAGDTKGLSLYIDIVPAEELRSLEAEHWEEGDPLADRNDPAVLAADAVAFATHVEASPAFQIPMQLRSAAEFAFEIDDIG